MKKINWNSDPNKEVEREIGVEFLRAVKIFYQDEKNRRLFDENVHIRQSVQPEQAPVPGTETPLCAVSNVAEVET